MGNGVQIDKVERIQDAFLENRGRIERAQSAFLNDQQQLLGRIEQAFAEPSDTALQSQLTDFWGAFADAANRPADNATRTALLRARTDRRQHRPGHVQPALLGSGTPVGQQLGALVSEINEAAKTVAQLNQAVVASNINAQPANELANQRDRAAMKLAELHRCHHREPRRRVRRCPGRRVDAGHRQRGQAVAAAVGRHHDVRRAGRHQRRRAVGRRRAAKVTTSSGKLAARSTG
jgi:hypothetical protein